MSRSDDELPITDGGASVRMQYEEPTAIVDTVVRGVEAVDEPPAPDRPLYDWIEPEAMVDLFAHAAAKGGDVRLEFAVGDCTVVVTSAGTVAVRDDPARICPTE
ncbi:hypothetical protein C488_10031 [Natrinema pellirubrum DSM 15624]|uniref:Halobacterial output domain-containing protein n=1 Tax=Natrinema pellirubrum (strain DSM 15624 / CIP 106293 / JCM 10476 / NCIMB 786 / 157) TaxID=797303 RepID=L0JN73_NATP1|nr:HalOD1 output domain-containing protein [Natrinema pellirubrum]AGB32980.1 hypothetical protein Natpe_3190 [Natrinema pellirubrum DSM 15624]ELY75084.1 hypothetical protein C488_10031 [Natrinema pellirubrum DSM 15624]